MVTVNRKHAEEIAAGMYAEDHPVKIVKYNNQFNGAEAFGVVLSGMNLMSYENSPACRNPQVWWTREGGRTDVA